MSAPSISLGFVKRRPSPSPRAVSDKARSPTRRCPSESPRACFAMSQTSGALRTNHRRCVAPPTTYPRTDAWIPSACRPAVMTMRLSGRPTSTLPWMQLTLVGNRLRDHDPRPFTPILLVRLGEHSPAARSDHAVRRMIAFVTCLGHRPAAVLATRRSSTTTCNYSPACLCFDAAGDLQPTLAFDG